MVPKRWFVTPSGVTEPFCGGNEGIRKWGIPRQINHGLTPPHFLFWWNFVYRVIRCPEVDFDLPRLLRSTVSELYPRAFSRGHAAGYSLEAYSSKANAYNQGCGAVTFLVGSGSGSGSGEAFRLRLRLRLRVKLFDGSGSGSGSGQNVPAPAAPAPMIKSSYEP